MYKLMMVSVCAGMLFGACGVEQSDEVVPTTSTEQSIIWECTGAQVWTRYWKVNGVEVGREDCNCDGFVQHGTLSGRYTQVLGPGCIVW